MNLKYNNYNLHKQNLRNKAFISTIVNLLIGILFSFPIFSEQANAEVNLNLKKDNICVSISPDHSSNLVKGDGFFSSSNFCIPSKKIITSSDNPAQKNYNPGNKDNSKVSFCGSIRKESGFTELVSENNCPGFTFVNLSQLKNLRVTKMRC